MAITSIKTVSGGVLVGGQVQEAETIGDGVWTTGADFAQGCSLLARVSSGSGTYKYWNASRARFAVASNSANIGTLAQSTYWVADSGTGRGAAATGDNRYFKDPVAVMFTDDAAAAQTAVVVLSYIRN